MIYVPDTSGARDKKEEIDEIKEEIYISGLEKQIDLINDEIDLLEERKDAFEDQIDELEKQKDAIEKMKDASNDYFESMIKQTETYYDKLIESLDKTKSRWEELADLKEEAEMKGKMRMEWTLKFCNILWVIPIRRLRTMFTTMLMKNVRQVRL